MTKDELYRAALDQFREHPRLYWTRQTFFLGIQSGLIVFTKFELRDPSKTDFIDLILAVLGVVIALVWLRVSVASHELLKMWRKIVIQLEQEVFAGQPNSSGLLCTEEGILSRSSARGEGKKVRFSITTTMNALAVVFILAWVCLLGYIGLNLINQYVASR